MKVRFNTDDVEIHLAAAGAGKAGWVEAVIPTPIGDRRFGDLKPGDKVFDRNGNPTTVTNVYPRGKMDAYKVTLSDGRSSICALDHLWGVYVEACKGQEYKVMTLEQMLEKGIRRKDARPNRKLGKAKFHVPAHGVHLYSPQDVSVDPYVFGVFTGNGCLTEKFLTLSTNDEEIVAEVADRLNCAYHKNSAHNYSWTFSRNGQKIKTTELFKSLYSGEKYIPQEYIYNSESTRFELLNGLFDTDGSASCDGTRLRVSYSTTSPRLKDDIVKLLLSVGIVSSVHEDKRPGRNTCYNILVNTTKANKVKLFALSRKKSICESAKESTHRDYSKIAIRSVEKLPSQLEMQCIVVDNDEHLYLCEDSIVTHNSTAAMHEIQQLLQVYRPDEIAFLSYTKKGVETGISKALQVNKDLTPDDLFNFKTLHALSFREAKLTRVNIMASEDILAFNKAFNFNLSPCPDSFGHSTEDDKLLQRYDSERAGASKGVFVNGSYDVMRYTRLINAYKSFKEAHGLVDFYDCLEKYMEVGEPLKGVKVFLIDESQDTTPLQWQVIMKMSAEAEKIRCYGDDFQTIFSHAGADPSILVEMAAHYKCVKHETSFRIPKAVYEFSKGITDIISEKVDKDYKPRADAPEGFVQFDTDKTILARKIRDDLKKNGPAPGRWYLLFRTNCFIDDVAQLLQQFIIPYSDQRGFCIDKRSLSKIKRYYQYRLNGYGSEESKQKFMQTYNIKDFNDDFMESDLIPGKEKYFFQDLINEYGLDTIEKMSAMTVPFCLLSTIHKVKGGEADYTALFMDCTKLVYDNMMFDADSELRVLYVGVTRCKEGLYIVPSKSKYSMQKLLDIVKEVQR